MSTPVVFDVQGAGIRFGKTEDGTPYSIASDFAKSMGYRDAANALRLLDEDEKGTQLVSTPGGAQQMSVIFEDGMWELIFRSTLPGAKAIKAQVKAILRQIRETGRYEAQTVEAFPVPRTLPEALRAYATEVEAHEETKQKVAELEPMAAQAAHHRSADGLIAVGDFANDIKGYAKQELGVRVIHSDVWNFLGEIGLIIRGNTVRHNEPTAFAIEHDYVRVKRTEFETNTRGLQANTTPRLTPAGAGFAWDRAMRRLAEHNSLRKDDGRGQLDIIQGGAA